MEIRLFDIQNGIVIPTEHCYTIKPLKDIMDNYPDEYLKIYLYLFYMNSMNPDKNPFVNTNTDDKESMIMKCIEAKFNTDDEIIMRGNETVKLLFETPTSRAYNGIKGMLDRVTNYMATTPVSDDNLTAIMNAGAKYDSLRQSFKGTYKDLMEEQKSKVRGDGNLGYDQK